MSNETNNDDNVVFIDITRVIESLVDSLKWLSKNSTVIGINEIAQLEIIDFTIKNMISLIEYKISEFC